MLAQSLGMERKSEDGRVVQAGGDFRSARLKPVTHLSATDRTSSEFCSLFFFIFWETADGVAC